MEREFKPLVVLFGFCSQKNQMTFLGRKGRIVITKFTTKILAILKHCNGLNTATEIRKKLAGQVPGELFEYLIRVLHQQRIVLDSRELFPLFHDDSANPTDFVASLSPDEVIALQESARSPIASGERIVLRDLPASHIRNIVSLRTTTRNFEDVSISDSVLGGLLKSLYHIRGYRSTPSAGGLYPLELFVAVTSEKQPWKSGYYQYCPEEDVLVDMAKPINKDRLARIFDSSDIFNGNPFCIFVGVDFRRLSQKYSNRAYRFALLETGHVAQNAYLYCAEQGLGVLEYGGFNDELVAQELGLAYPNHAVLISLIVGNKSTVVPSKDSDPERLSWTLQNELVGRNKPIASFRITELHCGDYRMPRLVGTARYRSSVSMSKQSKYRKMFAFGSGRSRNEVVIKTLAEAFERHLSDAVVVDKIASAKDLDASWIDPRIATPFLSQQFKRFKNIAPFSPELECQWIRGRRLRNGELTYVLVDHVYYPLFVEKIGRRLFYEANSTGTAAHVNSNKAIENALLELIERDAFAVMWYTRRNVTSLPTGDLPREIQERMTFWESQGRQVKILNITLDSVPVVLVLIKSSSYPCLVSGAAAAFTYEQAVNKAFDEAEFMLLSWMKTKQVVISHPRKVRSPDDHGVLYFSIRHHKRLAWLLNAPEKKIVDQGVYASIVEKFDPIVVLMGKEPKSGLQVIRVLSEKLLPMNFGYATEHPGHNRIKEIGLEWTERFPAFPHFFS